MLVRSILLLACASWAMTSCDQGPTDVTADIRICTTPFPAESSMEQTVFCADTSAMQLAPVVRTVDGDTIRVTIDGVEEPVRFYGIDTPERGEPCFSEATQRTKALAGSEVRLLPDARDRDRNARLLRYVYTPKGLSLDATLISEGLAHAWTEDGALREPLMLLEAAARRERVGCLWAENLRGRRPQSLAHAPSQTPSRRRAMPVERERVS